MDGLEAVWSAAKLTTEFYNIYQVDRTPHRLEIRSDKCPMWETAKRLGADGLAADAFCRPHELYYQDWVEDLGQPVRFTFARAMGRGDGYCHWLATTEQAE